MRSVEIFYLVLNGFLVIYYRSRTEREFKIVIFFILGALSDKPLLPPCVCVHCVSVGEVSLVCAKDLLVKLSRETNSLKDSEYEEQFLSYTGQPKPYAELQCQL